MENYVYDGKCSGNILIVGRIECGKTTFVQKLALNNFFGDLKKVKWISGIRLSKRREAEIESNFSCEVKFSYPIDEDEFADKLEEFNLESESENNSENNNVNVFGEKSVRDRLIVFDDVSGLADTSKKFVSFLTVARKYSYNCVYIFHTIYPEKSNWRTILSQTNIFNIFPASVSLNMVRKILEGVCIRKTSNYIPHASLWISRLLIELANRNDKVCLTLDCSNTNRDGPGRFRSEADNPDKQLCYFNSANDEQVYNEFVSKRIKSSEFENNFQIVEVKSKTNKNISFDASNKLQELNKDNDTETSRSSETFRNGTAKALSGFSGRGIKESETMKLLEKELNRDIFSSDKVINKKTKTEISKYSSTKVKARNFLTNVSYTGIKDKDYQNRSFVIDIFSFLILYLNPFYLERKFESNIERDSVNVLWSFLMPETLHNFICRDENVKTLNKIKLKFPHAIEIVKLFIEDESIGTQEEQFNTLKDYLIKNAKIYQFIFGNIFPR